MGNFCILLLKQKQTEKKKSAAPPEECMSTDYRLQWRNIKDRYKVFCKLQGQQNFSLAS